LKSSFLGFEFDSQLVTSHVCKIKHGSLGFRSSENIITSMGKPGKERQKKYLEKLKLKNKESYLQKERERKRKQRAEMKSNKKKYQEHLEKDRMRKRKQKGEVSVIMF